MQMWHVLRAKQFREKSDAGHPNIPQMDVYYASKIQDPARQ